MLHPYEPGKIPVLLVHGLRSSPAAWMKVINDLRGDPFLRDRYQFWLFMYPTGTPFPGSAAQAPQGPRRTPAGVIDPSHNDRALDRMVLVGHSMGGLISKMMIESERRRGLEAGRLADHSRSCRPRPSTSEMLHRILLLRAAPERQPGSSSSPRRTEGASWATSSSAGSPTA